MQRLQSGKLVTSDQLNTLIDEINRLGRIATGNGLLFENHAGGPAFMLDPKFTQGLTYSGSITAISMGIVVDYTAVTTSGGPADMNLAYLYLLQLVTFQPYDSANDHGYMGYWIPDPSAKYPAYYACNMSEFKQIVLTETDQIAGNGVDVGRLHTDFPAQGLMPAPIGTPVLCWESNGYWFFQYENAIDGSCTE